MCNPILHIDLLYAQTMHQTLKNKGFKNNDKRILLLHRLNKNHILYYCIFFCTCGAKDNLPTAKLYVTQL